ncbi:hypothetical protein GCM10010405_11580 [Streptomyces macrosporus]|uniref:Uncharacterized protein n=2 Tax=Streptomyces macrosporus TaxID=44032 RepID=A0ABP5WQF4_9ACTN
MYTLLTVEEPSPEKLASVLAECFRTDPETVEVSGADADPDTRAWDALVSCEYEVLRGDVAWSLSLHARDGVPDRPDEPELARRPAGSAGTGSTRWRCPSPGCRACASR